MILSKSCSPLPCLNFDEDVLGHDRDACARTGCGQTFFNLLSSLFKLSGNPVPDGENSALTELIPEGFNVVQGIQRDLLIEGAA